MRPTEWVLVLRKAHRNGLSCCRQSARRERAQRV